MTILRGAADEARLASLRALAEELGVADSVAWAHNRPLSDQRETLLDTEALKPPSTSLKRYSH
jgi:hypothetical protein